MCIQDPKLEAIGEELLPFEMGYLPEFFRKKGEAELNYTPSNRERSMRELKKAMERREEMFIRDHKTATIGEELLPLKVGYLPEYFRKKGEAELNYTPSNREKSLKKLKDAMVDDKTFRDLHFNDQLLLLFLNSRKYDIDRTLLQIKKYLKYRRDALYMFINIKLEELIPFMTSDLLTVLPWRCQDGCAIGLLKLGNWDAEKHPIVPFKKMFLTCLTQPLRDPMTQVNGFKCIVDLNIGLNVWRICTPQNLNHLYRGTEKILPARVKEYHIVNMGVAGRTVWQIMSIFLSEKVLKRVHIHETTDKLLDFFPRAVLPVDYGGDLKDYDMTEWLRKVTTPEELAFFNIMSS